MASLIGGIVAAILGVVGLINWWNPFVYVLKGTVPFLLILCGAVAIGAGFGSVKDKLKCCSGKAEGEKAEDKKEEEKPEPAAEQKKDS